MTPEQYTRKLEIALKVIQVWVGGSQCHTCQNVERKCKEALKEKPEEKNKYLPQGLWPM